MRFILRRERFVSIWARTGKIWFLDPNEVFSPRFSSSSAPSGVNESAISRLSSPLGEIGRIRYDCSAHRGRKLQALGAVSTIPFMCRSWALGLVGVFSALALGCVNSPVPKPSRPAPPAVAVPAPAPTPPEIVDPTTQGPVWFRIGDRVVREEELDDWIRDELFRREVSEADRVERWSFRAEAAERVIDELVIAREARRRGIAPEAVLAAEIEALGPVTAAELLRFFEENRDRWPAEMAFEDAAPDIRAYLEGQRPRQARERLRRRARVRFISRPPGGSNPNRSNAASTPPVRARSQSDAGTPER